MTLGRALASQEDRLLGCVHCGFCLPACPTYLRLGDEADSPRGRLVLMRAVVEGRLDPGADAFQTHIDRCLGCRACETVCPSGVEYGHLLEWARQEAASARRPDVITRGLLAVFARPRLLGAFMALARLLRATRLPALASRILPPAMGRVRLAAGMLASTAPADLRTVGGVPEVRPRRTGGLRPGEAEAGETDPSGTAVVLEGCVQAGLFSHVNRATHRVLGVNGVQTIEAPALHCCGALHAHAGALTEARRLARRHIDAFVSSGATWMVVNAAGCGATMKGYGELLEDDERYAVPALAFARRVVDVTELLASLGPVGGAEVAARIAYDAPCHLLHGQGLDAPPLTTLAAVPGLEVSVLPTSSECCGGAGIYGITHPELGGDIGSGKGSDLEAAGVRVLATGNPGCIMQIGAESRRRGLDVQIVHPVELLDESYRRAGLRPRA